MTDANEQFDINMVQECVSSYVANRLEDGSVRITIDIPQRFSDLWLVKLSDLTTSSSQIRDFEPE